MMMSLSRLISYWAEQQGDRVAIRHDNVTLTWAAFEARTNRLARAYAALGVGQDDFVTIALPNGTGFFEACFATWKLGATPQPVSARLPAFERDQIVELASPALVVGAPVPEPGSAIAGITHVPADFEADPALSDDPLPEATAASLKAMTSGGSTGRPKLIVAAAPSAVDPDQEMLNFRQQGSVLIPGPLYHNGPFLWAMYGIFRGNQVTVTTRFDAEETLRLLAAEQVDLVYMVPTMMQRIWSLPEAVRTRYDLSALKVLWHLAAPCPDWLKEAYIEWLGPDVIWELYGGTEGQGRTVISGSEWLAHRGSVGRPVEGCAFKIFDDEGNECPPGEVGELFLLPDSGQGSTYRYVGAEPRARAGGWESLGDLGWMDADGYLYLSDRRTDMVLSGGANIYPAEVEAAIDACPGVRSSAVIGLPHEDLGEQLHAIVDTAGAVVTEAELLAFLRDRLVTYKLPRSVEFVSSPLRDDAGKVRRKALRQERLAS
jgi:bile acid-coenzyme A ligase